MRNSGQSRIFARKRVSHGWSVIIIPLLALLAGTTSCLKWSDEDFRSQHPDKVLFNRAMSAEKCKQFDVAELTLQTLLNTYPNSDYSDKAKQALKKVKAARSDKSRSNDPECSQENSDLSFAP